MGVFQRTEWFKKDHVNVDDGTVPGLCCVHTTRTSKFILTDSQVEHYLANPRFSLFLRTCFSVQNFSYVSECVFPLRGQGSGG